MKKLFFFLIALSIATQTQAEEIQYGISDQTPVSRMIRFSIPYSMGIHEGEAHAVAGGAVTDENDNVLSAQFQVPIESITTGNRTRDCHLREALGINYNHSRFPYEHVCDEKDQMPTAGPDSVQYPDVTVEFQEMSLPAEPFTIGTPKNAQVKVKIQIHGVERTQVWPVMITKTISPSGVPGFKLVSQFTESLKDFGVKVKPFELGFIKINVKDTVTVQVALDLVRR